MTRRFLLSLLALGAAAASCSPIEAGWPTDTEFSCTEMTCSDRLEVTIERLDGLSFDPGEYEFTIQVTDKISGQKKSRREKINIAEEEK